MNDNNANKPRILLVDDDPSLGPTLKLVLAADFEIVPVLSAGKGIQGESTVAV